MSRGWTSGGTAYAATGWASIDSPSPNMALGHPTVETASLRLACAYDEALT